MYGACKNLGAEAPLSVSIRPIEEREGLERIEPVSDVLLVHPYFMSHQDDTGAKEQHTRLLDEYVDFSKQYGRLLLVTETCWGSLDDQWRVENIRYTLAELKKRNIGWLAHALHFSLVADLHYPEDGPVGEPRYMAFINKDGSLRPGHEVFNEY